MNTSNIKHTRSAGLLAFVATASLLLASCATAPQSPPGSAEVRDKLTALQANAALASKAPVEIREAAAAVLAAEQPVGDDVALGKHRVYMADRKVEIAIARAERRYAEDQRAGLSQARDDARLDARTREADRATRSAEQARREAAVSESASKAARASAERDAAAAADNAKELQRQIDVLQAEATERGLVLTLGDVLFATGRSDLKSGGTHTLDKLVSFLNDYPKRTVAIEGHTDDVGSLEMNQTLSQQRAESVKSYLLQKGIQPARLAATGLGETQPIADNSTATGRQQNRRVEIIIENPPSAIAAASGS